MRRSEAQRSTARRTAVTRRGAQAGIRSLTEQVTVASAAGFKKKTVGRRVIADLWTTNRQDARVADSFTQKIRRRISSGQLDGRDECYSKSSGSVNTKAILPFCRSLLVLGIPCQH